MYDICARVDQFATTPPMSSQSDSVSGSDDDFDLPSRRREPRDSQRPRKASRGLTKLESKEKYLEHVLELIRDERGAHLASVPSTATADIDRAERKETRISPPRTPPSTLLTIKRVIVEFLVIRVINGALGVAEAAQPATSTGATAALGSDKGKDDVVSEKAQTDAKIEKEVNRVSLAAIALKAELPHRVTHEIPLDLQPNKKSCRIGTALVTTYHPDIAFIGPKKTGRRLALEQFDVAKVQNDEKQEPVPVIYLYTAYDHRSRVSMVYYYNMVTQKIESNFLKAMSNLTHEETMKLWAARNHAEVFEATRRAHEEWLKGVKEVPEQPTKKFVIKHEVTEKKAKKRRRDSSQRSSDEEESLAAMQTRETRHTAARKSSSGEDKLKNEHQVTLEALAAEIKRLDSRAEEFGKFTYFL
jgi:hypothetical protein